MKRNHMKLVEEYTKKFNGAPYGSSGIVYASDFMTIEELIKTKQFNLYKDDLLNAIDLGMKAGIMIGYKIRKSEERKRKAVK